MRERYARQKLAQGGRLREPQDPRTLQQRRSVYSRIIRLKKYGLTPESYDQLLMQQEGCCASCRQPPMTRRLAVDYDKTQQKVLGLLCYPCRMILRASRRNPDRLADVRHYLIRLLEPV